MWVDVNVKNFDICSLCWKYEKIYFCMSDTLGSGKNVGLKMAIGVGHTFYMSRFFFDFLPPLLPNPPLPLKKNKCCAGRVWNKTNLCFL